jgi:glycosyltransferase involved in cell wall biosynthesis
MGMHIFVKSSSKPEMSKVKNSKLINEHLRYFYDNPGEIRRTGRNARRLAEKYSWERLSRNMTRVFERIYKSV